MKSEESVFASINQASEEMKQTGCTMRVGLASVYRETDLDDRQNPGELNPQSQQVVHNRQFQTEYLGGRRC